MEQAGRAGERPGTPARRLFFALWPEASFCAQLLAAAAAALSGVAGRALPAADLHVTLCFLGAATEAQIAALRALAARIQAASFELQFDRLEYWRAARIIVATAPQVPAAATELARSLAAAAQAVGLTPDDKPLRAHLTLMRGVSALPPALEGGAAAAPAPGLKFVASRFYLAESQGLGAEAAGSAESRRYQTLACWPLRP